MEILRTKNYVIPIHPISWQRAKLNGRQFFDGQIKEKLLFGIYLKQQHNDEPLFDKPIHMDITFFMEQPVYHTRRKIPLPYYHYKTPDLDNLCKFLMDSFKDVLITDDKLFQQKKYTHLIQEQNSP